MRRVVVTIFSVALLVSLGCNQSPPADTANSSASAPSTAPPSAGGPSVGNPAGSGPELNAPSAQLPPRSVQLPDGMPPHEVVRMFLEALRDGDDVTATALLTTKAQTEIAKIEGLAIQPPGTPTTQYEIGQTKQFNGGAQVGTTLRDQSPQGEVVEVQMTWILRPQAQQWRVAGMVAPAGGQKVLLNFEDPRDMLEKWEAEQARLASEEQQPPQTPPRTGAAVNR